MQRGVHVAAPHAGHEHDAVDQAADCGSGLVAFARVVQGVGETQWDGRLRDARRHGGDRERLRDRLGDTLAPVASTRAAAYGTLAETAVSNGRSSAQIARGAAQSAVAAILTVASSCPVGVIGER